MEACRKAKVLGADIALFPEMWSNGYDIPEDAEALQRAAVPADGEFVSGFGKLAAELNMAIAITFLEKTEKRPRNAVSLFDRHGRRLYTYAKVHTCDFGDECRLDAGEDFFVASLDTEEGAVRVGSMICYDREFPESARLLMLQGAELILVPNACPMELNRLAQLRARSFENMAAVATCNYPLGQPDCNGRSTVFDGVVYLPELSGSRDICLLEADGQEGIYLADLDLDMLRAYREREVHGNAYRRPASTPLCWTRRCARPFSGIMPGGEACDFPPVYIILTPSRLQHKSKGSKKSLPFDQTDLTQGINTYSSNGVAQE